MRRGPGLSRLYATGGPSFDRRPFVHRHYASSTKHPQAQTPLTSILIANRGEIALRVKRTAAEYGIKTTAIYTDPDANAQHALSSPNAINLGHPSAYLDGEKIIAAAKQQGCVGIHPGYGFLSENSAFARQCVDAGLTFIGPPWEAIEAMGNKSRSKDIMTEAGVPCIPGYHGANQDPAFLKREAEKIGFPVLLKAVKGGGGKGMRIASDPESFMQQLQSAKSEAKSSFGNDVMLVEKYITTPRHIEVQIFADKYGNCVALGERDCSIQRRHQKILEESPAPLLEESLRQELWRKACSAALAVGYEGAGTVEFIFDNDTGESFFMEMNTRLQVEHPVTEMITGEDLVRWQIIVAEGGSLPLNQQQIEERIATRGHAIEARIYAENPNLGFVPDSGVLTAMRMPPSSETVRIDTGFIGGDVISAHYDPMIAKLIVRGENRESAIMKLHMALEQYQIAGVVTNIEFLKRVCIAPAFIAGEVETGFIGRHKESLFAETEIAPEVYAQAAIASYFPGAVEQQQTSHLELIPQPGFGATAQNRLFKFSRTNADGSGVTAPTTVKVLPNGTATFDIEVDGKRYNSVTSQWDSKQASLTSFFPHTRIDSLVTMDTGKLTIFQQGQQHELENATPDWVATALGVKDAAHSVLAPVPCKILRVEVASGDSVRKDDALVVIESMKMETTIRSPQDGIISRVVHQEGDLCKAGTALVEFEQPSG